MAMSARDLARHHDLDVGDERVARRGARQLRIRQPEHPAFGLLGADELGRAHRLRAQVAPVPHERDGLALGLERDTATQPRGRHVL